MLSIRLTRKGKKNQPFFKVVVIDKKRSAKGGRVVEFLGFVDPLTKKKSLKKDRILHWIKNGAKPSATMHNLLVREKIILAKKINVSKVKSQNETKAEAEASNTSESKKPVEVISDTENPTKEIADPEIKSPSVELPEPKAEIIEK